MNLVFVSSTVPLAHPQSGFDIANRVIGEALLGLGHQVKFVGFAPPGAEPAFPDATFILGRKEFTTARAGRIQQLRWLGRALGEQTSFASAKMMTIGKRTIEQVLVAAGPIDGLVLNSVQLAAAFLPVFRRYPFVYVAHNVEHLSARENAASASSSLKRRLFAREARHLERQEALLCTDSRHVFTLSEADRDMLARLAAGINVLPLVTSIAPPPLPPPPQSSAPAYDVGLIGTWTWQPNRVGLDWFLSEVVPHLDDDISIGIAGNLGSPPPSRHPGLKFLGRVPDARAFVESTRVVALASRGGTGVQLKTIEAFELGLPTVATASALRGQTDKPANCIEANDPRAFAEALQAMVRRSRDAENIRIDGRYYHAQQLERLHARLAEGLAAFGDA